MLEERGREEVETGRERACASEGLALVHGVHVDRNGVLHVCLRRPSRHADVEGLHHLLELDVILTEQTVLHVDQDRFGKFLFCVGRGTRLVKAWSGCASPLTDTQSPANSPQDRRPCLTCVNNSQLVLFHESMMEPLAMKKPLSLVLGYVNGNAIFVRVLCERALRVAKLEHDG